MKKSIILLFIAAVFIIAAVLFTFSPSNRYGFHTDSLPCGKNPTHQSFYTATTYMLFTWPSEHGPASIGTCPYQSFSSNTYALELWLPGIIFGYFGYKGLRQPQQKSAKSASLR